MIYLNVFKQLGNEAVAALYGLVKELINKNTTNILEVGTYAGQVTVQLCAAAAEENPLVTVISIDKNADAFSPSAEESLKKNNLKNYAIRFGDLDLLFEKNIISTNIIYIDRFHKVIEEKLEIIKRNIVIPTKVIFRNPTNASDYPFDVMEFKPEIKPRARKKVTSIKEEVKKEVKEEIKEEVKEEVKTKVKDTTENKKTTL